MKSGMFVPLEGSAMRLAYSTGYQILHAEDGVALGHRSAVKAHPPKCTRNNDVHTGPGHLSEPVIGLHVFVTKEAPTDHYTTYSQFRTVVGLVASADLAADCDLFAIPEASRNRYINERNETSRVYMPDSGDVPLRQRNPSLALPPTVQSFRTYGVEANQQHATATVVSIVCPVCSAGELRNDHQGNAATAPARAGDLVNHDSNNGSNGIAPVRFLAYPVCNSRQLASSGRAAVEGIEKQRLSAPGDDDPETVEKPGSQGREVKRK
ncbi:uncharacterized protein EI90DRAFT_3289903 [Cantharellus anzutake]|uniref:uncharacterized protein n=1 Tax=Cantharellus anzutake TaxID=1750568 RepID=UPI0019046CD1|nr:uncharacterized protein EI90DRAFT_3289903 [Cantharellus anzutake]KAF8330194.1 hypothetical protein EI90DRAFT_3289903 [Cantharellus anzutake]